MIAPESCTDCVSRLRFLTSPVADNQRQLLVVEITVGKRTSTDFSMYFFVPTISLFQDEISNVGVNLLNDAMDAWDLKENKIDAPASLSLEQCGEELSEISGCTHWVKVNVPRGPCSVVAAWSHALLTSRSLFIPTQNESLSCWCSEIIVIGSPDEKHGMPAKRPLMRSMRWDLMPAHLKFPNLDETLLIRQWSAALPFHNLHFALNKRSPSDREHFGVSGSRLRDDTRLHLVSFCDVGFQTVPIVCGCYVKDGLNYEKAHVPLSIMERVTRREPIVFFDGPEGSNLVQFRVMGSSGAYRTMNINILEREEFGGVNWVTVKLNN
jgi:hypothetical protein